MINFNKALINAARSTDCELLEMAIAGGADIKAVEEKDPLDPNSPPAAIVGNRSIEWAIYATRDKELQAEHLQIVRRLIEIGVDVNGRANLNRCSYPLHNAVLTCHELLIRLLLESGATFWTTGDEGAGIVRYAGYKGIKWVIALFLEELGSKRPDEKVMFGLENALCSAAFYGHVETARTLLDFGVNVDVAELGSTALMRAIARGHEEVTSLLLERGANRYAECEPGGTVLIAAAQGGATKLALELLAGGAKPDARDYYNRTSLHEAAYKGDEQLARELIRRGANVKARDHGNDSVLHSAAYGGNKWIIETCLDAGTSANAENDWGYTPLMNAAKAGQIEAMQVLVARGAKVRHVAHYMGETALHYAIYGGHVEAVRWLLERGADIEAPMQDQDWSGRPTALGLAAIKDNLVLAQLILDFGARLVPNDHEEDLTPLHHAAQAGAVQVATLLVSLGAPIDILDEEGNSPLHFTRSAEVARILLEAGADSNIRETTAGTTPLRNASEQGNLPLSQLLLAYGADPLLQDSRTKRIPREVAANNGHLRVVQLLDEHVAKKL